MEITIPELAILISIGLLSISISINAKGPVRTTFSYAITALILLIGGSIGFLGMNSIESPIQSLEILSDNDLEDFPEVPDLAETVTTGTAINLPAQDEIKVEYLSKSQKLLRQSMSVASNLSNFDFGNPASMSDEEYERIRQKASSLHVRSSRAYRALNALPAPTELQAAHQQFKSALKTLSSAASSAKKFFNAETSEAEDKYAQSTNKLGQSALVRLSQLKAKLK